MNDLQITKEKALKIYDKADAKGKALLVKVFGKQALKKNAIDRIKTIDDILADNDITKQQFESDCEKLTEDEKAYRLIKMLCLSLNQGWKPNWKDSDEFKYFPWFEIDGSSCFRYHDCDCWYVFSIIGSRLCFVSRELAEYAGKQFTDIYKDFMIIN